MHIIIIYNAIIGMLKIGLSVLGRKMLPDDDGHPPIPTGHVSDSGDCKITVNLQY